MMLSHCIGRVGHSHMVPKPQIHPVCSFERKVCQTLWVGDAEGLAWDDSSLLHVVSHPPRGQLRSFGW